MLLVRLLALYCCAAVTANQKLPRHEIIAKMIERAKQMDSLAADEMKAVLGHELQPPLHGKALQPLLPSFHMLMPHCQCAQLTPVVLHTDAQCHAACCMLLLMLKTDFQALTELVTSLGYH